MFVSIIGDSISTFHGFNPEGYSVFYTPDTARLHGLNSVYDTWWAQVNQFLKAYLCINNSYSGSSVSGTEFPAANCAARTAVLHQQNYLPDLILVYLGFNDFGSGIPVSGNTVASFEYAYERMLTDIRRIYPRAWVICGTLMKTHIKEHPNWTFPECYAGIPFEDYNAAIRRVCARQECVLADLAAWNSTYETLDGTHPTAEGHKTIAAHWISCLKR